MDRLTIYILNHACQAIAQVLAEHLIETRDYETLDHALRNVQSVVENLKRQGEERV